MRCAEEALASYMDDLERAARVYRKLRGEPPEIRALERADLPLPHRLALR